MIASLARGESLSRSTRGAGSLFAPSAKKFFKQPPCLLSIGAMLHQRPPVTCRLVKELWPMPDRPAFWIRGSDHKPFDPRMRDSPGAHGTRLKRHVKGGARQSVILQFDRRIAKGAHLSVPRWIMGPDRGIASARQNGAGSTHQHGPDRRFTGRGREARLIQRQSHHLVIFHRAGLSRAATRNARDTPMTENSLPPDGERIAKYLARAGVASRREAEKLIEQGIVSVDGKILSTPAVKVTPDMDIRIDGIRVGKPDVPRLWRFHKSDNLVTTHKDPQGRPTVFDALAGKLPRVISVGRLDLTTEGLLLLTNSGELARELELPSTGWTRRYRVRAHGRVKQSQLDALSEGVEIDGVQYGPIRAALDQTQGGNQWISVSINEGKNREIRNVMRSLDLQVNRLIRTAYGPFQLGKLNRLAFEEVPGKQLKEQLGKRICEKIGL